MILKLPLFADYFLRYKDRKVAVLAIEIMGADQAAQCKTI